MAFKMKGHTLPGPYQKKSNPTTDAYGPLNLGIGREARVERRVGRREDRVDSLRSRGRDRRADRLEGRMARRKTRRQDVAATRRGKGTHNRPRNPASSIIGGISDWSG
jgi:hypothetical protein